MRKLIALMFAALFAVAGLVGCNNADNVEPTSTTVWKEVPVGNLSNVAVSSTRAEFDLKETITQTDFAFSGTILNIKEYENSWIDEKGEQWGPFPRTVLEVKVGKEYYGTSPIDGNVIKVCYPHSASLVFKDSISLKKNEEYVFLSWVLDEKYIENRKKHTPEDRSEPEKHADVIIGGTWNSLFSLNDGKVILYNEYFCYDNEVMKQALPYNSVKADALASPRSLKSGDFIVLNEDDFDRAFLKLFKSLDTLPDADDLRKLREAKNPKMSDTTESLSDEVTKRPLPPPPLEEYLYEGGEEE